MSDWVYLVRALIGLIEVLVMAFAAIVIASILKGLDE